MEPLLSADHLRRLRTGSEDHARKRHPAFDLAGAGRLVGAACTACLLLVMLQAALSAPARSPGGSQVAVLDQEETDR